MVKELEKFKEWVENKIISLKLKLDQAILEEDTNYIKSFSDLRRLKSEISTYEDINQEIIRRLDS
jgi:adenine-specific DNA methylase